MNYQLILQWPLSAVDYDVLIDIEDILIEGLTDPDSIDGHDFGAGQANIFLLTDMPRQVFEEIRLLIGGTIYWSELRAAYRIVSSDAYTILWPCDIENFELH